MKLTGCLSKFRKCLFLLVLVLPLLAALVPVSPVMAAPTISISPASGAVGTEVTITGSNFDSFKGDSVIITFDEQEIPDSPIIIPDTGTFAVLFVIPDGIEPGIYAIEAIIQIGTNISRFSSYFKVTETQIQLDLPDGHVGTEVTVSGSGFHSGRTVTVYYYNIVKDKMGTAVASSTGTFAFQLIIPVSIAGMHRITAENTEGDIAENEFEVLPAISLNFSSGSPGMLITVNGNGFAARSQVSLNFDIFTVASVRSNEFGNFTIMFNVPEVKKSIYEIRAQDALGNLAKTDFTTTAGILLDKTSGPVGLLVTVRGVGFTVGAKVTIDYDNLRIGTIAADNNGAFSISFAIPAGPAGDHVITADDGTNSKKRAFRVESEAPPIPELLLPSAGSKTTAATYLDWQDVTDPSLPVTYELQIATDENFITIILEKLAWSESEYTLTEEEWLRVSSAPVTFYWRVRAIDSARNESQWAVPYSFSVSGPPAPKLLQQEADSTFEKTVFLNWQDVDSLSPPVKYTLQIASDLNFATIILEKTALADSEYYVSDIAELDLFIKSETYYWRVKAIDSVNNESDWANPTSFSIISPFTWPTWATYLSAAIVVIIVVYLAFRIGKRTALQPPD